MMSSRFYCACVPLQVPSSPISKTGILASVTFSRGIRCDGVRPFHWQERTQMQSRKRAQAAGSYPLCVRALHLNRCPQQGSCLALHCHIKTLPLCETGRPGDPSRGQGRRRHGRSRGRGRPRAGRPTSASRYVSPEIPNQQI